MAFSLDRTVAYLKICEPDLISIHRSTHPVVPSDNCSLGHLCDAFICLTRENGSNRILVALHDIQHKSNLVFVADSETADNQERSYLIREAVSFLTGLGFTMEPVNLGFSPAMREVIMHDLKIMRPPKAGAVRRQTQPPAKSLQAAIDTPPPQAITTAERAPQPKGGDADREANLATRLAEATSALERVEAEKKELVHKGTRGLKALKDELGRLKRELDASETARLAEAASALERFEGERKVLVHKVTRDLKSHKDEMGRLRRELDSAETARCEAEKALSASGVSVASLEIERDTLLRELAVVREEVGTLRVEFLERQAVRDEENAALLQEVECLRGERATATVSVYGELETERDDLLRELAVVREEAGALRSELLESQETYDAENQALRQEVESLRGERATAKFAVSGELECERDALLLELASVRDEVGILRGEFLERQTAHDEEIAAILQEVERLHGERTVATVTVSGELEALHAALAIADEALSIERSKNESALREMDALERNAAAELKSLQKKIDTLSSEKRLLVTKAEEMKDKAKGEIERLRQENQSQRRAAVKKLNTLKEELNQFAETRAIMTSPVGLPLTQVDTPDRPVFASMVDSQMSSAPPGSGRTVFDPFLSDGRTDGMSFEPDSSMKGIYYSRSEDLVEVHRSFNKIQAAPAGNLVQNCEAFVCLVKDGGQKSVYVVWLMNETGDVLVCRPGRAPENAKAARHALREGVDYFERVGFFMDRLELESDPEARQCQLDTLPIFHRIVTECAA